ncbi:putative rhamnogalacturonase B [Talaromyces atroroseus]|uniref:Putative rhamnogalacturonase B n=1 Tax=Talaromyces atroroseus TaxID=1441469 RepID=A0A225AUH3_TALAT|nr:putative rhamnogalacturonase B [Talaromyces atroroseus]OKL60948.1 putative rhamnogalacturonase B [Talaromyces atroroseus]
MALFSLFLASISFLAYASAQLSGSVGPLTSITNKKETALCNVVDYGAVADNSTDLGPALKSAFEACIDGGLVYIPSGDYLLETWVTLSGGSAWALQIDGIIYRGGTDGGNMIYIEHATDFELFSSTSSGAVQGSGYLYHIDGNISGPRILRLYEVTDFSVHDIALTDSPSFHFTMDTCTNGEVYNMAIRGGNEGGLDGIDVWGDNIWIHDSPAENILVEDIYCNMSGGCAIGSLALDTSISNIQYRNIYTWSSNQMMMIKSNEGSGTVENVVFENFIGILCENFLFLCILLTYWSSQTAAGGEGVTLTNITFSSWTGTEANGALRGPVRVVCSSTNPCTDITISDFAMWTETGDTQWYLCESAYGSGFCLKPDSGSLTSYTTTTTVSTAPTGYSAPTMAADLATGFGTTRSIPIPTIPTSFFPGATPISSLAADIYH